ncbi:helix-turn-helix transcriptional regulator [Hymenobacter sp. M29]|uniref:Helix-turn-helix transcriptional regulator n=1 Tax=Hymenobacter mellowenesis TaxID=3063995 RepID=A0ABT9AHH5_9BACT|nr:helix-turn-helix transcriptional regulator [Hymenobacter sp. M29]MDO7849018.1 helix-turn-helix transcriptional regulator [Hymenobacter sp. M29]
MKTQDIKKRRKALGWSQAELGAKIGITNETSAKSLFSKYEKADAPAGLVSEERLAAIDKALSDEEQLRRDFEAFKAGRASK